MIIKTTYSALVNLMSLMNLVISGKTLQDDYKVVNLFVKNDKLHALSTDCHMFCLDSFEGTFDLEGEANPFMVIRMKECMDILSKYSSLQRTQVKEIILATQQKGIVMTVVEEPKVIKDSQFQFSDLYKNQPTRYKLSRCEVKGLVTKELPTIVLPDGCIEMSSKDLQKYLDYMYVPMTRPKENVMMHFSDDFVYSVMGNVYGVAMPNTLPLEIFDEVSISSHYVNFLRNVIPTNEKFKIYKEVDIKKNPQVGIPEEAWSQTKAITLIIQSGSTLIKLRTVDQSRSTSTNTFKVSMLNTVEVDKPYLIDTLKRIEGFDQVYIEIIITEDENVVGNSTAEFIIKTQRTIQKIPVKCAHGNGEFKFMLRPENLSLMAFTHLTKDLEGNTDKINDLIFYMDILENGSVSLVCKDKTEDWQTRYPKAPIKEAPQLDF